MTIFGNHQTPLVILKQKHDVQLHDDAVEPHLTPDHHTKLICIVLDRVIISLGQELVVQHTLGEDKPVKHKVNDNLHDQHHLPLPVPLLFPEPDLVSDCGWNRWTRACHTFSMNMHVEEPDDLCSSNPTPAIKQILL